MNRKQLFLLLVALAFIGGACLLLLRRNEQSWSAPGGQTGKKLLQNFQVNDVAAIHLKGESELTLARKAEGWCVLEKGNYPANFSQISELLLKISDLKIVQSEPIAAAQLARMHLAEPGRGPDSGVLVEFKDAQGNVLQSLLLGKKHVQKSERPSPMRFGDEGFPDGRYVMLKTDPQDLLTVSDPLNNLDPKPAEWLDKDFFKVEKPQAIAFVSTNAANSWRLTRESESAPWVLADPKPGEVLDTNKVASLAGTLSYPSFVDVASDPAPDKTGMDKPLAVSIETFDHFTYTLDIGNKTPENDYHLKVGVAGALPSERTPGKDEKPDDKKKLDKEFQEKNKPLQDKLKREQALGQWTYLVNGWLIDPLIRDRAQLMVEKKAEKPEDSKEEKKEQAAPLELLPDSTNAPPQ
ncbi:MAG: DUF4340 domain-containing protein [Verrucomicrobiota bacterium]|jgi:hypothetical protein